MIGGVVAWGRQRAEARMTELVQFFTVVEGEDPVTLQPVEVETVLEASRFPYGVPARVKMTGTQPQDVAVAGQLPVVDRPEVHVPVGSVLVGPSVMVRVLSSSVDDGLVGAVFRTRFGPTRGQVTAWRYPVEYPS